MTTTFLECPRSRNSITAVVEPKLESAVLSSLNTLEERVTRFQQTRSPELFNQISTEILPSLEHTAHRLHARGGFPRFIELGDLVQYGSIGLIHALESFDAERGVSFRAFAARRIEGAMLDGIRGEDPMSRRERRQQREIKKSIEQLASTGNLHPCEEEIHHGTTLSAENFAKMRQQMRASAVVSLDQASGDSVQGDGESSKGTRLGDTIADSSNRAVDACVLEEEMWDQLGTYLSPRERYIIEGHLREGRELREFADELGVSRAFITHIKGAAIERIREVILSGDLSDLFFGQR